MTFKKSWFSYCLWAIYAALACVFQGFSLFWLLEQTPVRNLYAQIGIICLSFALAAGVFALLRWLTGHCKKEGKKEKTAERILWETLGAVLLLGAGLFLRIYFMNCGTEEAAYFETAGVNGAGLAPIAHGAQYLYVLLLRGLFFLAGNHFVAAITLQIALQMLAAVIFYLAVRRLLGPVAALTGLFGIMLLPESIRMGLTCSPKMLYFLFYGIGLLMTGRFLRRKSKPLRWYSWVHTILLGAGIGVLSYLDVAGLTLLLPLTAVWCYQPYKSDEEGTHQSSSVKATGTMLPFCVAGISFVLAAAAMFLTDALLSQTSITRVFQTWCTLFAPKSVDVAGLLSRLWESKTMLQWGLMAGIAFLLLLGVPGFFVHSKEERQMPWFVLTAGLGILWAGGFSAQGMQCDFLLLAAVLLLLGAGLEAAIQKKVSDEGRASAAEPELAKPELPETGRNQETETESEKPKQIHYIENPLPLPKKHVKKTMGYRKEVAPEEMKYDIEISEDDDFDI